MSTPQGHDLDRSFRAPRKALVPFWLLPLGVLACLAGFVGFTDAGAVVAREALEAVGLKRPEELNVAESRATQETSGAWAASAKQPWDGMVHLTPSQRDKLGVKMAAVVSQSEPMRMEIQGKTDYNPDTIIKVRPRFDALVLTVHATVGKKVEKGDPLVELYSVQLAEAKLPYISVLSDPTMGGVSASFCFLGDVVLAEPKALIPAVDNPSSAVEVMLANWFDVIQVN
jgi:hypothetical protein